MSEMRFFRGTGIHPDELATTVVRGGTGRQVNNPDIVKLAPDARTDDSRVAGVAIRAVGGPKHTKRSHKSWAEVYDDQGQVIASTHKQNPLTVPAGAASIRLIGNCKIEYFPEPKDDGE